MNGWKDRAGLAIFRLWAIATLLLVGTTGSQALEIDVISQSYQIDIADHYGYNGRPWGYSYQATDTSPVYSPDSHTHASGNVGESGTFLESEIWWSDGATSLARIMFRPLESASVSVLVELYDSGANASSTVVFTDDTMGTTLLDCYSGWLREESQTYTISFDAGHFYQLNVKAWGLQDDEAGARVTAPFTITVPDFSSTSLLLGIAVCIIVLIRRVIGSAAV